jgi:ATP-binding protein involved in chromosome partitioning
MFQQVKVPVLGMIENMSYLQCPHCEERIDVFSNGGGKRTAEAMSIRFLGALPLDPHVRLGGDTGHPVATAGPEDQYGRVYYELAKAVMERAREASNVAGPTMTVSD